MEFGIGIKPEEQKVLLARHRAITERLPEEMNPVWCADRADVLSLAGVEETADVCENKARATIDMSESQFVYAKKSGSIDSIDICQSQFCGYGNRRSIATSPNVEAESPSHTTKNTAVDIPTDADGLAENPDAYRLWQPKKMQQEVMSAEEWQERWSKLRERRCRQRSEKIQKNIV